MNPGPPDPAGAYLLVPGLLQPPRGAEEAFRRCPGLTRWLIGARRTQGPRNLEDALGRLFDTGGDPLSLAALRYARDFPDVPADWVAFADPVHLRVDPNRAILFGPQLLQLTRPESVELIDALNSHLAADSLSLALAESGQWYLRGQPTAPLRAHALGEAVGRNAEPFLPFGEGAGFWRRLLNELQMLLHAHPLNRAREERGAYAVSSVWPWAGGGLPRRVSSGLGGLLCDDPAIAELGARAGLTEAGFGRGILRIELSLQHAADAGDVGAWEDALSALERNWREIQGAGGRALCLWPADGTGYRRGPWRPWRRTRWPGLAAWSEAQAR